MENRVLSIKFELHFNAMDDKKNIEILLKLLEKYPLTKEEILAVRAAVGVFSWTSLSKGRLDAIKKKKLKDEEW